MIESPLTRLAREIHRVERLIARSTAWSRRLSRVRLATAAAGGAAVLGSIRVLGGEWGFLILGLTLLFFYGLTRLHDRLERRLARQRRWRDLKNRHVAALHLDWSQLLCPAIDRDYQGHPYATDLNLVGPRSFHHLLSTAASSGGAHRLADWLTVPPRDLDVVRQRQALIRDLKGRRLFRDKLTLAGHEASKGAAALWHDGDLMRFISRKEGLPVTGLLVGLSMLAALNEVLLALHIGGLLPAWWPFTLFLYVAIYLLQWRRYSDLFDEVYAFDEHLRRVASPLNFLESTSLVGHGAALGHTAAFRGHQSPAAVFRRIRRIAGAAALTQSELLKLLFNVIAPWDLFFAFLMHREKRRIVHTLPAWLDAWYSLEAASALATWADHHPEAAFPEFIESPTPTLRLDGLTHPLIARERAVANSVTLGEQNTLLLVTGSNMSGKSTFLRSIGLALGTAYTGGAVDAHAARMSLLRVFTCMNVTDSVQDGLSFFYAEVRRLKVLLDAAATPSVEPPLLYLIDEIFRGTNNRERLIGSRAYIQSLARTPAIGLIATHDLELTALEAEIDGLHNVHFREEVSGGTMHFDYLLHEGPCPTTNALEIMRFEGLPVPR